MDANQLLATDGDRAKGTQVQQEQVAWTEGPQANLNTFETASQVRRHTSLVRGKLPAGPLLQNAAAIP